MVANGGVTLARGHRHPAEGYPVKEQDVVANRGGFTNNYPHAVVDEKTSTNGGARVNFHAGSRAGRLRQSPGREMVAFRPQPVGYPVSPHRV